MQTCGERNSDHRSDSLKNSHCTTSMRRQLCRDEYTLDQPQNRPILEHFLLCIVCAMYNAERMSSSSSSDDDEEESKRDK